MRWLSPPICVNNASICWVQVCNTIYDRVSNTNRWAEQLLCLFIVLESTLCIAAMQHGDTSTQTSNCGGKSHTCTHAMVAYLADGTRQLLIITQLRCIKPSRLWCCCCCCRCCWWRVGLCICCTARQDSTAVYPCFLPSPPHTTRSSLAQHQPHSTSSRQQLMQLWQQ